MSVNLNILANKAIRGVAEVNDISSSMQMYVSGSPYIVYAVNNFAGVPYTNIPPTSSYCSSSVIEWSPDSSFSTGVTSSAQNCNSSSLSGSLLFYGSFSDDSQPGGVLNDNLGYEVKIFDTTIPNVDPNVTDATSVPNKTYYFRSKKQGPFLSGSYTSTVSTQLGKVSSIISSDPVSPNEGTIFRNLSLFDAVGYNEDTHVWYSNYPPTAPVNLNRNATTHFPSGYQFDIPGAFVATASIATGSGAGFGWPTIAKYGNIGSDVMVTSGSSFTFPVLNIPDNTVQGVWYQFCIVEGSALLTFNTGYSISINCGNQFSLVNPGSEVYGSVKTSSGKYYTGLNTRNGILSWQRTQNAVSGLYKNIFYVNGVQIDEASPFSFGNTSLSLTTSTNCVLRFIATDPWDYFTQYRWQQQYSSWNTTSYQHDVYKELYGTYTGSLSGN